MRDFFAILLACVALVIVMIIVMIIGAAVCVGVYLLTGNGPIAVYCVVLLNILFIWAIITMAKRRAQDD